ncbi:RND family efflux transporter MFP subunit [Palleronia aestuarii]|uniref:RND family efflux transporter MFP subunit n=1 Tax=Palleronia aestuarii TaxID=568105 RepID=A0A2W7N337_9RHOB|nr:efflux RND transporter periplasmic adaptor subunit [Palleronia aestuarii]PZX14481.1 RND family efflux transporter MFP subunit [Palleronia aestuarii]
MRLSALPILLCLLAAPLAAQDDPVAASATPQAVKLVELNEGAHPLMREFFGRVRAKETVDLAFQVSGQIVAFPAVEGRPLAEGQVVAELDLTPFRRALERAEVTLAKANRDLARLQELSNSTVAEVQIRDAQTEVELAEIAVEDARDRLEDATLETSFDALIARREVANFSTVAAGEPVVRLHDMSELRVDIEVPEILFRRAADGNGVTFTARFPGLPEEYPLALREFEAETAEVAQTYTITLAFTSEIPGWALPGASVTVTAMAPRDTGDDILVPETAIVFRADRTPGLMVYEPDPEETSGTVTWQEVKIEVRDDARIAVVEGVEPGRQIVAAGASGLTDGQAVRPFTGLGN